jgi:hypothetical protein
MIGTAWRKPSRLIFAFWMKEPSVHDLQKQWTWAMASSKFFLPDYDPTDEVWEFPLDFIVRSAIPRLEGK